MLREVSEVAFLLMIDGRRATLGGTAPSGVEHQLDATSPNTRFAREGRKRAHRA
jgi:hypothetical protein